VHTLLGSCVSVTMFNPRLKWAAICHAMLADPDLATVMGTVSCEPYKYVSIVVPTMIERFRTKGISPEEVEVKLFGGANVFGYKKGKRAGTGIGAENILRTRELLARYRLKVLGENVGGHMGRKIIFNTVTGVVWMKRLKSSNWTSNSGRVALPVPFEDLQRNIIPVRRSDEFKQN